MNNYTYTIIELLGLSNQISSEEFDKQLEYAGLWEMLSSHNCLVGGDHKDDLQIYLHQLEICVAGFHFEFDSDHLVKASTGEELWRLRGTLYGERFDTQLDV